MRLIELKEIIDKVKYLLIDPKVRNDNGGIYVILDMPDISKAISILVNNGIISKDNEYIDELLSARGSTLKYDDSNKRDNVFAKVKQISDAVFLLDSWLNNIVSEEESENTINIILPSMDNLDDLQQYVTSVQKGFNSIVNTLDDGIIKFKTLDRGSSIITFTVGAMPVVAFIGACWKLAMIIIKDLHSMKMLSNQLKQENAKTDLIEQAAKIYEKTLDKYIDEGVNNIIAEQNISLKEHTEDILRISKGIKEFITLINDGAKIQPSLNAPEEIAESFPGYIKLLDRQMKYLKDNSPDDERII